MGEINPFRAPSPTHHGPEPAPLRPLRVCAALTLIGWGTVAVIEYATTPLLNFLPLPGLLIILGAWSFAIVASASTVRSSAIGRPRYIPVLTTAVVVGAGVLIGLTDWNTTYTDSQFTLHRSTFDELAEAHDAGTLSEDVSLPLTMRYLTSDGQAHIQSASVGGATDPPQPDVLYVQLWQNWRAESGYGIAHFRFAATPHPDALIMTALGDLGKPSRHLGNGWWVIE